MILPGNEGVPALAEGRMPSFLMGRAPALAEGRMPSFLMGRAPALAEGRMPSFPVFGLRPGGGERQ